MEYNRTTVQQLLQAAAEESFALNQGVIDSQHILMAMMKTGGVETEALTKAGANYATLSKIAMNNEDVEKTSTHPAHLSSSVRALLDQARQISQQNGEETLYAEYVLFAILNDRSSFASVMLTIADVDKKVIYQNLVNSMQKNKSTDEKSNLKRYGKNLNEEAEKGKIDPVIGRDTEINRVIQILSRRTKNNPVLIGEPGVGKTAIAEGLAQRIVSGKIPDIMRKKTVYSIDMASMVAGTKYRGDFEQRLNETINELLERDDAIVFIDELHTIIGAGSSEGSLDASNILKPALSKGKLQMIGATTIDEYRKRIEKDAALERRFQPVMVREPSKEDTNAILRGLRPKYEDFHHVHITDEALEAATDLTDRYLTDRYLPDKAIDVIDEALARVHVDSFVVPKEMREMEAQLQKLEEEKTKAALTQEFERAAELRDQIVQIKENLRGFQEENNREESEWPEINFDNIASIVSQWSHVPITKLTEKETDKYLHLADNLKKVVIGQDYAVDTIASALKRARVGLKVPDRPIGSFIFVGPTGVGKTYLAKQIAEQLFGSEENMIRIDMSEYMERYSVSRLVGSAPGYVGYEDGGQLTEAVRKQPYSVVLFDEIEKAHPDVFNILLQVLDDGRLTDSQGRTVDFRNTVIILTSNVGATRLNQSNRLGFGMEEDVVQDEYERMKDIVHEELKSTFRPEFLNRLDDVVVFHKLSEHTVDTISKLLLNELMNRVHQLGYALSFTEEVAHYLAKESYQPEMGARPLERQIRTEVEDLLSDQMLRGKLRKEHAYRLEMDGEKIVVRDMQQETDPSEKGKKAEELVG
ncbi:MAG: ATP-dependent Clp protease ATP-binding subunit [Peptoniphilaceae bacterium]|nr:ATP-dependent Clp protease ATP-binding subunit [Peptoniphilaceae bacterium]MDY5766232.1 ATP-dependent Clp protease ATP-binding subunit [Peptoniphilaceae bacterium]